MTAENQKEYGPSWNDVRVHLEALRKAHNRATKVEIAFTSPKAGPSQLYFRVVATGLPNRNNIAGETACGHVWPASDWKTVPAMLLALIHRLDWTLTEVAREAERQAEF